MTRVALDSNILAYIAGVSRSKGDDSKIEKVRATVEQIAKSAELIAPVQALGELFVVLRKGGTSSDDAREILIEFTEAFGSSASQPQTVLSAADLVVDHKLQFWDAMILTAAVDAGCSLLLSEDMQDGFVTRGLMIANPLATKSNPRLRTLLEA